MGADALTDGGGPPLALVIGLLSATLGGLGLLFAMLVVGRRRSDESGALVLATAEAMPAATGVAAAAAAVAPAWPGAGSDILPSEVGVPRWRRQSLRETRMRSERDIPAARVELRFRTEAEPGVSRRVVAYSLVRLSSEPDDILGQDLGWLDRGDEVEVLETRGVHWLVRTPDGAVGWIHRTTLEPESTASDGGDLPVGGSETGTTADAAAIGQADAPPETDGSSSPLDDFFRFSTGGLGTNNGEPRVH